ncbi:DNA polymerase/3'-5' exonuclease PolX [Chryseotalea sanaruensis]|uniref:DNA polymerase beta n=2 Tax=Chryseotalea sanaruensis TaxID=2482724 RepID=A0A401U658_9BACT|nr:DNA polymerase/3'-5' exonuclease PolX [Chryseotalea sanaruensis]
MLASIYRFLGGDNPFRAIAYENASRSVRELSKDISFYDKQGTLTDIQGIGKSIESDIKEFLTTGVIGKLEKLKHKVPIELLELMDITGFGPQSLKTIYKKLHLQTKEEVIRALEDGSIQKLKGFGPRKVENLLRNLKLHKTLESRMLLYDALLEAEGIINLLSPLTNVKKIEMAGSLRRRKETIGDIDILIAAPVKARKKIIDFFVSPTLASKTLARGETRASIILKANQRQADIRIVEEEEWGSALQYFTGSKAHNIHLRSIAKGKDFKINEYGVFNIKTTKRIGGRTEEEIYNSLQMQMIPPEMREDHGEIELALNHNIPSLVRLQDIRGDLQMHSNWSDGQLSLDDLVEYVRTNFKYEYIAITDHSKSSRIAKGMDEKKFLKQISAIEEINKRLGTSFLKSGAEVDILSDGTLDLSDEVLAQLDWVTASIHVGFKNDNTKRLVRACQNNYVHCIGHPTGRLIGKRESYPIDFNKLLEAAKETGTLLEINAQPNRMDLHDEYALLAQEKGVKLVISTDSHKASDYDFMKIGLSVARRAWCKPEHIANTLSWKELKRLFTKK